MERGEISRTVLLKLIEAILREEELENISKIISADPNLTAKILTFVNSAYCSLRREIHSVEDAIAYIGYRKLKEIAFALLVSATLKDVNKEELLKSIQFAYLMKALAKRAFPKLNLEEDAFLVGILSPVFEKTGDKLLEELENVCISKAIIDGLKNNSSPLGKLRTLAQKLFPWCEKIIKGEREFKLTQNDIKREIVIGSCLESQEEAQKLAEIL